MTVAAHQRAWFPGWRWAAVALAFPLAGLLGWAIGGPVDATPAALIGGALTGAGLGAVQWWAGRGAFGTAAAWIGASALSYGAGLAIGAGLVGYGTDLGDLALMGVVSGAVVGAAQGLVLARQPAEPAPRRVPGHRDADRPDGDRRHHALRVLLPDRTADLHGDADHRSGAGARAGGAVPPLSAGWRAP